MSSLSPLWFAQVIAGQIAGTLFNTESARMVALEAQAAQSSNSTGASDPATKAKKSARDAAIRARDASRTLQALPSEVSPDRLQIRLVQLLWALCA